MRNNPDSPRGAASHASYRRAALFTVPLILLALVPVVYPEPFILTLLVFVGIYIIVCTGLSLIFGYAGQLSLTQAAFYGIGAYASALLTTRLGMPFWIGLIVAAILPGIIALAIGAPILRLRHYYLAMATLAFSEIMAVVFIQEIDITGGPTGISHIPPPQLFGLALDTPGRFFYLVWTIAAIVVIFSHNLIESKFGRALRAISDNELAAGAMGVNVAGLKSVMFVLSAIFAGIGGSLYAHFVTFVSPDSFTVSLSILLVIMVAVGGVQSLWGAVLGAVFITVLPSMLGAYRQYAMLVYGLILVLALMFLPNGIAGLASSLMARIRRSRAG
ncbi:MAG: branched-chain amino acid ABC transporter permease [Burkholderiales bacterium]